MASFSGTSGGSGGGSNQPPLKRIKIEDIKVEPDLAVTSESSHDAQSVPHEQPRPMSRVTRWLTEHLKCPVCDDFPRREVYQCSNGHIICHVCIAALTHCPLCREVYSQKKIRNRVAESDLDEMTFDCSFMNLGCLMADLPRDGRIAHEIQCVHNRSPSGVKFCSLLDDANADNCPFRIDPNFIMQDAQHCRDVINHLTSPPLSLKFEKIKIGETKNLKSFLPGSFAQPFSPVVLFELCDDTKHQILGYYVLIRRATSHGSINLSWTVVGLNSVPGNLNGGNPHSGKVTVNFSIKAKTDPDNKAKDGIGCVPDQSWRIKSMSLNEWKDFVMIPTKFRPKSAFSFPVKFLHDFYRQQDYMCQMSVSFGRLID